MSTLPESKSSEIESHLADQPERESSSVPLWAWGVRAAVVLGILGVGAGISQWMVITGPSKVASSLDVPPREVQVLSLERGALPMVVQGWGVLVALDQASVPAQVSATVKSLPGKLEPGMAVRKGQVLVELDDTLFRQSANALRMRQQEMQAQLERMDVQHEEIEKNKTLQADLCATAETQFVRVKKLLASGAAAVQDVERAQNQWDQARLALRVSEQQLAEWPLQRTALEASVQGVTAQLLEAQERLARCQISAPISGVLQQFDLRVGDGVQPGALVARVVSPERLEARVRFPAGLRGELSMGQRVSLAQSGGGGWTGAGELVRLSPEDDSVSRTMTAHVRLLGDDFPAPGSFVKADVAVAGKEQAFVLPRRSVLDGRVRYVREDGTLSPVRVKILRDYQGERPSSGLPDVEWLLVLPMHEDSRLEEGMHVVLNASLDVFAGETVVPSVVGGGE